MSENDKIYNQFDNIQSDDIQDNSGKKYTKTISFAQDNIPIFDTNGNAEDSGKTFGNDGTSNTVPLSNEMQAYVIEQLLNTPDLKSVNVASTANLSLSGLSAIDGYTPIANNLILAKNQTNTSQNGIYFAKSTAWVRAVFNKTTETFQELTGETTYADLNINGGVVNVLGGNVGKNLQFQFSIQTPTATFGNSPVYVGATTKIPPRDIFNGFVSNNIGNDTNNNGSPAFPYASISKDLISASYPHCTTIASNGGSISESITFTSGNSNLTIQSSDTTTDAGKTSLTGQMTSATGHTRGTFKNTTHSTGANIPFVLQAGSQARHKFENLIITTTNPVLFDIDAGVLNWMNVRNLDCDNSPASTIPLPNFTAPFTINIFNQTRRLPFSLKAGATGLNCTIILFNCPDFTVRIPSGFAGTVRRFDVRKVNEVITTQIRLTAVLADTTLNGYYLISGFTPTSFKKGCIFGKQSAGGFTENWLEREFEQEQASIYDFNTKKTYIQDNGDWVSYQAAQGAVIDDTELSTSTVYSSQKSSDTFNQKRENVIFAPSGTLLADAVAQIPNVSNNLYTVELHGNYTDALELADKLNVSVDGIGANKSILSDTINIGHTPTSSLFAKKLCFKNLQTAGINLAKFTINSKFIFEDCDITSAVLLDNASGGSGITATVIFDKVNFNGNLTLSGGLRGTVLFKNCNFNTVSITNSTTATLTFEGCLNIPSAIYNLGDNAGNIILQQNNTVQSLDGLVGYVDWSKGNSYRENQIVNYEGNLYRAKQAVPSNTPFSADLVSAPWSSIYPVNYTEWANWNMQILGSVSNPTASGTRLASFKVIGKSLHLKIVYQGAAMSGGSGDFYIPLPSGYTADTSKVLISTNLKTGTHIGCGGAYRSTSFTLIFWPVLYSSTAITFRLRDVSDGGFQEWGAGSARYGTLDYLSISAEIPIL
jgi:hypothetical protein